MVKVRALVKTKGKGRPKLSAEERDKIRDEIKEAMLSAAQTCDAGNLPAGIKRLIQNLTEPVMNWRELLRMQLEINHQERLYLDAKQPQGLASGCSDARHAYH
jgi:hypothetical protein